MFKRLLKALSVATLVLVFVGAVSTAYIGLIILGNYMFPNSLLAGLPLIALLVILTTIIYKECRC